VLVNSLGGPGTKPRYRETLVGYLEPLKQKLSEDSQRRLVTNPLRILDSKDPRDQEIVQGAPSVLGVLDDEDKKHFDRLRAHLDSLGTPYEVDAKLVRGLDYYSRTLFEIRGRGGDLGAQNTLLGGGRYDGLVEELGGPKTPAIGFATGIERLLLVSDLAAAAPKSPVLIAPLGERAATESLVIARELRAQGIAVVVEGRGGSLKSMLRRANAIGAKKALVIGDGELDRGVVQLKDLEGHAQRDVARADLVREING
ncbi:MAG: His/Gly/Thr/Pro-type tRNA ligase C-terminal domain-containing protein, partial [Polyangiales bacterium]